MILECGQMRLKEHVNLTNDAIVSKIPWHVGIFHNKIHKCSGILINPKVVMTSL